jgi:hypothetical protein
MPTSSASLIAEFMPSYSLRQIERIAVGAPPAQAYCVARAVDLHRVPLVRRLSRLASWLRIGDLARPGSGFVIVGEEPGREIVIAAERPGFAKLACSIRIDRRVGGGSWLTVEVRVTAADAASLVIGRFAHAVRHGVLRLLAAELGPVEADATRALAGDGLLAVTRFQKTHATTIEAPVEHVWPWLVQMGARRAGWYSFDFLDNGRVPSAERIVPELQSLSLGDIIPALPKSLEGFAVLGLDPMRSLVLGDPSLIPTRKKVKVALPYLTTWSFVLEPIGSVATQLTVRIRAAYLPSLKMSMAHPVMSLVHDVMERRQLHNLRRLAEAM